MMCVYNLSDLFHKAILQAGGIYAFWGYRGHRHEQKRTLLSDTGSCSSLLAEGMPAEEMPAEGSSKKLEGRTLAKLLEDRRVRNSRGSHSLNRRTIKRKFFCTN